MHSYPSKPVNRGDGSLVSFVLFALVELGMVLGIGVFGMGLSPTVGLLIGLVVLCFLTLLLFGITDGHDEEQLSATKR